MDVHTKLSEAMKHTVRGTNEKKTAYVEQAV